ncbi:hypothetical protein PV773_19410 [Mesorhizobium sp. CC13]|uniref:hypothetical protein n=1 Tax=Mesorhizobium sp. CC13 TaxID=3029194 RepID=UPI0032656414
MTPRLDGNMVEGDNAADENVFRHFRHLHYWLAFALVRTFSPPLHQRQVKRPGQQATAPRVRSDAQRTP